MNTNITSRASWVSGTHLVAEAVGGSIVGLLFGLASGLAAGRLLPRSGNGWDDLIYTILGAIIGYTIGVSLGVYLIGKRLSGRGGYWRALLGGVLGVVLVMLAAEPLHLNQSTWLLQTFLIILPPIGATLGFNMRRKARK